MTPVEFRGDLWHRKTGVPGLSCSFVWVILCLAVLTQYRFVTNGQTETDRRTQDDSIYRASIASRGKEIVDIGRYLLKLFESFVGVRVFSKHGVEVSERPC